jgi:outer membrane protein assembly factor BamB
MIGLLLRALAVVLCLAAAAMLTACGGSIASLNPFKEKEIPLPGDRISVMKPQDSPTVDPTVSAKPISLPAARTNQAWSQPGGVASNAPGHLSWTASGTTLWRASAGSGSSSDGRLTASPIVYRGRVFTLDAEGEVAAFSEASGDRLWRISLSPENESGEEGFGGGLAADGGKIVVATGFGTVVALNVENGEVVWKKTIGVPIRTSPTAAKGKMFFVATDSRLYCLSVADGAEIWTYRGLPGSASLISNVSPAVSGDTVVVPFTSGDVIAYRISEGKPTWVDSLAKRRGGSSMAALSDPARPAIDKGVVFAVGHSGKMVAMKAKDGARLWSLNVRGTQTPWVAGNTVFVVDVNGKLMALARDTGKIRWITDLPESSRWNGPVLAGSKLWLASAEGLLVGVDPNSGQVSSQIDLDTPIFIAPIVASNRMYILTDKARLYALN